MPESKEAKLLQTLAAKSPQGFAWATGYLEARAANPDIDLQGFLKSHNVPEAKYMHEVGKATSSPGDVLAAIRKEPGVAATLGAKITVPLTLAPEMPKAVTPAEKGIAKLAQADPTAFAVAKAYTEAPPGVQLDAFLKSKGIDPAEYTSKLAKLTGVASGDIFKTLRAAGDFAEGVVKVVAHSKFGKMMTAGSILLGALTGGANASTLPELGKSFAVATAGALDPTALVGPSVMENAVAHAVGRKSEMDEMGVDTTKIALKTGAIKAVEINSRIEREQKFIMDSNHPAQLGALTMKDSKGGAVDVAAVLRDPARRGEVLSEIDRRIASAESPHMKEIYNDMKAAAVDYAALEDRRKPMPAGIVVAAQPAQGARTGAPAVAALSS